MKFTIFKERESKQYVAHMMYQLGIEWSMANKIGTNEKVFTALNEAEQLQDDDSYDKAFELLQTIKGIGNYRAELYIEKYFENPYKSINWKMFEILKKYQDVTKWTDNKMYDIARKVDDPSKIWDTYLSDDQITLSIAADIYKITTKDSPALQSETIQYFVQHSELRRREKEENILTSPKFIFNEELNEKYNLFLEVNDDLMLTNTAKNYATVLNFFKNNKDEDLKFELHDIDISDFGLDQKEAFDKLKTKKTMLLTGFAGTGKTYMLDKYIHSLAVGNVYVCSLAGKAVKNFVDSLNDNSKIKTNKSTIAGLKYVGKYLKQFQRSRVCIVDEASMSSLHDLAFLINNLREDSKLILIGDINQLPAIDLDALNWLTSEKLIDQVVLDIPKRQTSESGIFKDSMKIIDYPFTQELPDFNTEESGIKLGQTTINTIIEENRSVDVFLTTTNKVKDYINGIMSAEIRSKQDGHSIFENEAYNKDVEYHEGEKIIIQSNNAETGLMNGDIFVINYDGYLCNPTNGEVALDPDRKKIKIGKKIGQIEQGFNSDKILDISAHKVQFAFAITTHKSQGSTLGTGVTIMGPGPSANRNLLYTALTRFKNKHTFYLPNEDLLRKALSTGVKWQRLNKDQQDLISKLVEENEDEEDEFAYFTAL